MSCTVNQKDSYCFQSLTNIKSLAGFKAVSLKTQVVSCKLNPLDEEFFLYLIDSKLSKKKICQVFIRENQLTSSELIQHSAFQMIAFKLAHRLPLRNEIKKTKKSPKQRQPSLS